MKHWLAYNINLPLKPDEFALSSVAQSCPTLCNLMNHRMPGLPVHHQLPEFTQTHVHRVGDAIQPSQPLLSPSPPAPSPFQHQGLFQWVNSLHEVAKVLEFQNLLYTCTNTAFGQIHWPLKQLVEESKRRKPETSSPGEIKIKAVITLKFAPVNQNCNITKATNHSRNNIYPITQKTNLWIEESKHANHGY